MARRKRRSIGIGWVIVALVAAFVGAGAIAYYVSRSPGGSGPGSVAPAPPSKPPILTPAPRTRQVTIFLPESEDNRFYLVPVTRTTTMKGTVLDDALNALLATTSEGGEAGSLIPKGTRLLYPVKVKSGVAVVDLSQEFVDDFSGGSTQEALTLNAIAHTLAANSSGQVREVQILVEGKMVETLGGHFGLETPIAADHTLLKPGSSD